MDIKGIIFDYGGTIDTDSLHWSEVLWKGYQHVGIPVSKDDFRTSYVFAERALAKHPYIKPTHNFLDLLRIKCDLETSDLVARKVWLTNESTRQQQSNAIAQYCYDYVLNILTISRPIIEQLSLQYPLVLVSNFYGNIETILSDFQLNYFQSIVESAVVGIRKPDPQIFQLGVDALRQSARCSETEMPSSSIVVIGDSFSKDIVPATSIGCKTVWIKGIGWGDEQIDESVPTKTISSISQLLTALT
ncbi:MAG: HAD family hydrolase [Prevotellaceae bacterium]|nr:HAD family hydrolase [Candidatus Minthosoma caballi]